MAPLYRVHGGATGGMSADILLAHCIAAAKVRRQSFEGPRSVREGWRVIRSSFGDAQAESAKRDGDWAIGAISGIGGSLPSCGSVKNIITVRLLRMRAVRPRTKLSPRL